MINRYFVHLSKAWYGNANLKDVEYKDDVWVLIEDENNNMIGEFGFRWYIIGNNLTAHLEVFDDAFKALSLCKDLIDELKEWDNKYIQPEQIVKVLERLGFKDITPYENPHEK
jgi:hypothetical protein